MSTNKQAQRSQDWILTALFQLMEEKDYSDISISEITARAGVARQTFYRNYRDKDDILVRYLDDLFAQFWPKVGEDGDFNEEMLASLFHYWAEKAPTPLINSIKDKQIRQLIFRSLDKYVEHFFKRKTSEDNLDEADNYHRYALKFLTMGVYGMLIEWMRDDFVMSPEKMAPFIRGISASVRAFLNEQKQV